MKIDHQNIIITGASSGIGKCLTELLSGYDGVKIVAVARRAEQISKKEGVIIPLGLDVSTKEGVDALFDFANVMLGTTDIFIANAGFAYTEKLEKPDWQHISDIFSLNVISPIYSLEKFVSENSERKIHFVSTISAVVYFPLPAYALYCSTKSALKQFMDTYFYEKKNNLTLSNVYPIATRTEFFDVAAQGDVIFPFMVQDSEVVARKIIKGIEAGKRSIYPSFLFRIFLPFVRTFPFLAKIYSLNEKRKMQKLLKN